MYDLVIKGGRIIDPSQDLDTIGDLAVRNKQIAAIEESIPAQQAKMVIDGSSLLVTPGLIDLHVHVFEGISVYGINADRYCLRTGATTVVDAGSAGAQTFPGFKYCIIQRSKTNVYAFLHLSTIGLITKQVGELENIRYADVPAAIRTIEENRDRIVGIKVRMEKLFNGENGWKVLELAREVSDQTNLPMMYHIAHTDPPIQEILRFARKGDIFTHCYHGKQPGGLLDSQGKVLPEVFEALDKGVLFDVGHGRASFSFRVARAAIDQGFLPHTISTDLHINNINGPVYDLPRTLSKFLALGLSVNQVIAMATHHAARSLGLEGETGTLKIGAQADVTLLELRPGPKALEDCGWDEPTETVLTRQYFVPRAVVRAGEMLFL